MPVNLVPAVAALTNVNVASSRVTDADMPNPVNDWAPGLARASASSPSQPQSGANTYQGFRQGRKSERLLPFRFRARGDVTGSAPAKTATGCTPRRELSARPQHPPGAAKQAQQSRKCKLDSPGCGLRSADICWGLGKIEASPCYVALCESLVVLHVLQLDRLAPKKLRAAGPQTLQVQHTRLGTPNRTRDYFAAPLKIVRQDNLNRTQFRRSVLAHRKFLPLPAESSCNADLLHRRGPVKPTSKR